MNKYLNYIQVSIIGGQMVETTFRLTALNILVNHY